MGAIAILTIGIWTHEVEYGSKQLAGLIGVPLYQVDSVIMIIAGSSILLFTIIGLGGILMPQKCLLGLVSKFKVNGYTFRGSNSTFIIFASLLTGDQFLKERICSSRNKFFPVRIDPLLGRLSPLAKQTGSH